MGNPIINEIGNKYGSLTVIEYTKDKNGRGAWLCKCDCGNTKIARGPDLRKNKITHCSKSCPCKINGNFINETGNKYGFLTVLYKSPNKNNSQKTLWHCKCECGNEIDTLGESLRQGLTKSCGCKSKELNSKNNSKDLTHQIFGYLKPIEIVGNVPGEGNLWRCKCNCGCNKEDILVPTHRLTSRNTSSCGRLKKSHGEIDIENFLKENNIIYQSEYSFENLISISSNKKLRFDFAIFNKEKQLKLLIEYDGEQHFKPIEFFGGQKEFIKRTMNDHLKYMYCQNNNIPLLKITYNENIIDKLSKSLKERNLI